MKKLMIAVAAAALIGGAQAELAYDFSASLKTTKAKAGSATTRTAKVGQNLAGEWWYEAPVFTASATAGYLDYGTYTKVVKINSATGVGTLQIGRLDNDGKASLAADLAEYNIPEIYKGKEKWCATWTYKIDGTCIRAKGSESVKASYTIDDCCAADTKFTQDPDDVLVIGDIDVITLYRFGGVIGSKCMNVEFVGSIGEGVSAAGKYTTIPAFALAGQGTWSDTLKDANKEKVSAISSITGYIVGIWYESECEVCCGNDASSLAYSCDLTQHNIGDGDPTTKGTYVDADGIVGDDTVMGLADVYGVDQWGTAAYGSFTLKYNSKNSTL